jgi:hypothetical protein
VSNLYSFYDTTLLQSVALRITSNHYSFSNTTPKLHSEHNGCVLSLRVPKHDSSVNRNFSIVTSPLHCCVETSVFIVAWNRLFSLLRGNVCFHCCVTEEMQQCRTIQLPRNRRPRSCYQGNLTCDNIKCIICRRLIVHSKMYTSSQVTNLICVKIYDSCNAGCYSL